MIKLISFILVLIRTAVFSQDSTAVYFEGKITYTITYEGKNGFDVSEFSERYGNEAVLYYKKGNSRFDFNGSNTKTHLYHAVTNTRKMIVHQNGKDTIIMTDLTKPNTYVISLKQKRKNRLVVEQCNGLNPAQQCSYRYDPELKVDPLFTRTWYYNNLNSIFHMAKSYWIYQCIETPDFKITWTATHIERTSVTDQLFTVAINEIQ